MDKPKEAIAELRKWGPFNGKTMVAILAYLDSIPDGAHICEWPKELTRERLYMLAANRDCQEKEDALRALAAIAPVMKKRRVNLWVHINASYEPYCYPAETDPNNTDGPGTWRKVAGPVEIEE